MKISDLLIWIIAILAAITPTYLFLQKKKYKERLPEMKKTCHKYNGTYSWLMSVYDDLYNTKNAYRSADETTGVLKDGLLDGLYLRSLLYMDVISESEAISKGEAIGSDSSVEQYQWAREILIAAIEKNISYKQSLINTLDYLYKEKINGLNCTGL